MKTIIILVFGTSILASGPYSESEDELVFNDIIYPKHVIQGYEIHEVVLKADESIQDFQWTGSGLVKILHAPKLPTEPEYIQMMDEFLQAGADIRHYDSITNAALRAGYPGPFHEEGVQYATWMDSVWAFGYDYLARVFAGTVPQPTLDELKALLPQCPVTPRV